ncbi:hypothetical protein BKA67DRAFT_509119 [Truncatella angustata]|uniref:polynucleotide adenylyltransferase n=1 Tax=Truncatella angustata TaxID=152316 RepID=A0A9P8UUV6_9PEZI|nr:uncharacterized protein BKA67DRAFT_509119 [Truncatella angustata]KAH6659604.1 hypothetical protein BKA67DRAFT_509119 [Truncatella angustata]
MATTETARDSPFVAIGSNETALCIIPPRHYWESVDKLRMLYDKAYEKWPPHVNLIYPFVKTDSLPKAAQLISIHLQKNQRMQVETQNLSITLNATDYFHHRHDNTVFIHDNEIAHTSRLNDFRQSMLEALGHQADKYQMHMTIGQSDDLNAAPHKFLLDKAGLIPPIQWDVDEVCILVRDRTQVNGQSTSQMKLWGTISLKDFKLHQLPAPSRFYEMRSLLRGSERHDIEARLGSGSQLRHPLYFSAKSNTWEQVLTPSTSNGTPGAGKIDTLKVTSYNVLAEFEYPPSQARYSIIVSNLLDQSALADVVVLQEVTDDFLCYLLRNGDIRTEYQFVSHGPPDQLEIDPLPSHLNVIVLSKWSFTWDWVSFNRRHKVSVVLKFDDIGRRDGEMFTPAVLAVVHLTCGLTDGAVAAKKSELQSILEHLSSTYPDNPTILAGDLNITTSAYTIGAALEKKSISKQTAKYLANMETYLLESGFSDAWTVARLENVETSQATEPQRHYAEPFEGEEGATFDPIRNPLAAAIVGSGLNNRPQRYDRILIKPGNLFSINGFNRFGQQLKDIQNVQDANLMSVGSYASDHWGIRCSMEIKSKFSTALSNDLSKLVVPVALTAVPEDLSDVSDLRSCLVRRRIFPEVTEFHKREEALALLSATLSDTDTRTEVSSRIGVQFVLVPVGSYGLGVWTAASDVDCLCIGSISPKTFFALATQRLRKASSKGIKVLRKVNALSGTMLELEVGGIKMDLQYCPSAIVAQTWPRAMELPANSPAFSLPVQMLAKLKPARDLYYLRRTIPDFAAFKTAFYLIKTWAKQRGIYAARFGYLGGIHIAILLSRVCKLLSRDHGTVPVPVIVQTFFNHYANFDWANQMVFDPFFHKHLRFVRTSREPMVILGFHSPSLNVATAASTPSVRTISEEFKQANRMLSYDGMTWESFLGDEPSQLHNSYNAFLKAYKSYIKIDVQFWGVSLAKGSQFVGWLESRCVMLLVDIGRRVPNLHARTWPARFVAEDSDSDDKDYQGCYLVGLDLPVAAQGQTLTKDDLKITYGSLLNAIQKFEEQIRSDEKYFDTKSSWMSASIINQSELGNLKLDHREWGEHTIGEDESEDDEEDEDAPLDDIGDEAATVSTKKHSKLEREMPIRFSYAGRFRSSADVINRIRWDPEMDSGDYVVGYRDRFLGIQERPLDQWKAEQTDEEFIPQHRIMYFKRSSDGTVVWNRRSRTDEVFGSGVKSNVV